MAADITVTFTPAEAELVKAAIDYLQDACQAANETDEWSVLESAHIKIRIPVRPPCPRCGVSPEPGDPVHGSRFTDGGLRCNWGEK